MSGAQVIITSPPDDGDGIVATPHKLVITATYTPSEGETPHQTERAVRHIQNVCDALTSHYE